ncbi:MAG: hypothetical protein HC926_01925 [Synechococcaceae cyanobacterium SM2_3_60]|nr:hypothetical protein [Synechococcaceae cyanobacterium SM2_3_60]
MKAFVLLSLRHGSEGRESSVSMVFCSEVTIPMAKKRKLKQEKAERNREYARQFQKSRARRRNQRSSDEGSADT